MSMNDVTVIAPIEGSKAVAAAGTAERLTSASNPCSSVIITARAANTKSIAWGFSNAVEGGAGAEVGACIKPGESIEVKCGNTNEIWIDAQVNGEGVSFTTTVR